MASIKRNIIYSSLLTISNYIFPLLVFPYISRVLGVSNIGAVSFVDSIVDYFSLLSMMGIGTLGVREIAKYRDSQRTLDKTFSSLIFINGTATIIAILIYLSVMFLLPVFYAYRELMMVGLMKLLFNFLLIEWLYRGLEDFGYITLRSIIVRCLYTCLIFIFVRNSTDVYYYYIITVSVVVINALINLLHSKKYVTFRINGINVKKYIKPYIVLGLYFILTSFYSSFNVVFLGIVSTNVEVGYYTTATKLYGIVLTAFTAVVSVLVPRMSALVHKGQIENIRHYLKITSTILFSISVPLVIYFVYFTPQIIMIMAGEGYEGAIISMRIVMPMIFLVGYDSILVIQTLLPLEKDKIVFRNSLIGAIAGIVGNIVLVNIFQSIGSAIVLVSSEILIFMLSQYYVSKYTGFSFAYKKVLKIIIAYTPLMVLFGVVCNFESSAVISLLIGGAILLIYSITVEWGLIKSPIVSIVNEKLGIRNIKQDK